MLFTNRNKKDFHSPEKYASEESIAGFSLYLNKKNRWQVERSDNAVLLFEGALYPDTPHSIRDILDFLNEEHPSKEFKKFKGRFRGIYINTKTSEVTAFTDQLGLYDIYYYFRDGELSLADSFQEMLATHSFTKEDLDETALAEFMIFQHTLQDRTFIQDIKVVPYASLISFVPKPEQMKHDHYWKYAFTDDDDYSEGESHEKLDQLLKQATKRIQDLHPGKEFLLGLSGGLDSRLVAKYALEEKMPLSCFVFGHEGSDALRVSRYVADALGVALKALKINPDFWHLAEEQMQYDPMMNVMVAAYSTVKDKLSSEKVLLTGFYGGELFGNHMFKNFEDILQRRFAGKDFIKPELLQRVKEDCENYDRSRPLEETQRFDFENRQLRFVKNSPSFNFYGLFPESFSPFADIDVVEHVLSVPPERHYQLQYYHEFYRQYLPSLARIRSERMPYNLFQKNKLLQWVKMRSLQTKMFVKKRFGISLPLFSDIDFMGALNWEELISNVPQDKLKKSLSLPGVDEEKLMHHPDNVVKFCALTLKEFINTYVTKS